MIYKIFIMTKLDQFCFFKFIYFSKIKHGQGGNYNLGNYRSSFVAQLFRDSALSLQWLELLLWYGFHPWLGKFYMSKVQTENKYFQILGNMTVSVYAVFDAILYGIDIPGFRIYITNQNIKFQHLNIRKNIFCKF